MIRLGYEIGTGNPVDIPLKHMAITGQTQEAGKTTALEALITRSGLRAVTFITKRGEGSFVNSRRIDPYFREQADWQFVASILEASRGEKLKFERAWIIRASKGASTLAAVQRNVRRAMETAKGMSADVYLTLDAYLDAVVPQIAAVKWAQSVSLSAGVNAMDLTGLNVEMQHLVIKSTLDWVLTREEKTVVVVPEAWKFIPQGRGTPVKLAAESFIRQAAGLHNFLWLDSQDIAGVEKIILKSVPVWVLGVQREANEVKRTLDNIPASVSKPSKADIAHLDLGQFFACWKQHAIKTYVQPAWMEPDEAQSIALSRRVTKRPDAPPLLPEPVETEVTEAEADALRAENEELKRRIAALERHEPKRAPAPPPYANGPSAAPDIDAIYSEFRSRIMKEPAVLRLLAIAPEIEVSVTRQTIEVDENKGEGMVAKLVSEGFFDRSTSASAAYTELRRRGKSVAKPSVYTWCDAITTKGFLTKEKDGYQSVPGMKVRIVEAA